MIHGSCFPSAKDRLKIKPDLVKRLQNILSFINPCNDTIINGYMNRVEFIIVEDQGLVNKAGIPVQKGEGHIQMDK